MRLSIKRLRAVLLAGALLLVLVLTAYIGYGRYRALQAYRRILAHAGASFTHDTNGFTYSQSEQGKTVFTLHAARATQLGDGKWSLHNADLTLYGRVTQRADRIYSSEIEYDEKEGLARAPGEVHMDLQAPQAAPSNDHSATKPEEAQIIHVRTSGLVYLRKLGVAATDQPVEFHYAGLECNALGAEFNSSQSSLRLLANVVLTGQMHNVPIHLTATQADLDRTANVANLTRPVLDSDGRTGHADGAILHLRKDGSIETLQANGHVSLASGSQQVTADRLDGALSPKAVPQTARLTGNVVLIDTAPLRTARGTATEVDAVFNEQGGPASVVASGHASLSLVDHTADQRTGSHGLGRDMEGERIIATFTPGPRKGASRLTQLHAIGSAHAGGQSIAPPATSPASGKSASPVPAAPRLKRTQVSADDLQVAFATDTGNRARPQRLFGNGHTLLQQNGPDDDEQTSSGDTLDIAFASQPIAVQGGRPPAGSADDRTALSITSALQVGHVSIRDRTAGRAATAGAAAAAPQVSTATAARADYDDTTQRLTLTGDAQLLSSDAALAAPRVVLDRRTQDADASGGVQTTFHGSSPPGTPQGSARSISPLDPQQGGTTHVLSATAHFVHATQLAEFRGSDAQPARVWKDASQVQAATLLFDGVHRTFAARTASPGALVHAVLASTPEPGHGAHSAASVVRVASPRMDYNDVQREAVFSGGVSIDGTTGEVRAARAVALLTPAAVNGSASPASQPSPVQGSLDRLIVTGDVQMEQPGRRGSGDQLVYTAATGYYVLTGTPNHPPHVADAEQGDVTGATLLFGAGGSTIVIAGDGVAKSPQTRVRTETRVRNDGKVK
jgi:lipopolysaccharide export system protein LptA